MFCSMTRILRSRWLMSIVGVLSLATLLVPVPSSVVAAASGGPGVGELVVQYNGNHWWLVDGIRAWQGASCGEAHAAAARPDLI